MRVFPKVLRDKLKSLESSISWLMTMTDADVHYSQLPNFEIKILSERVKVLDKTLDDIYNRLNKYEIESI
tara:strand:+ start:416 stop:625 length:210 start_codon:yes stop_codon:yes gene_type:complete